LPGLSRLGPEVGIAPAKLMRPSMPIAADHDPPRVRTRMRFRVSSPA
jgi:hypothetical protein